MSIKRLATGSAVAFVFVLVGAMPALAAAPSNDAFPNARVVPGVPFTNVVNTTDATTAADDPNCTNESHTVWYRFRPAQTGRYQFSTSTDGFPSAVAVFSGSRGALSFLACGASGGPTAVTRADLQAGTLYRIMAGTYNGRGDPAAIGGRLTLRVTKPVLPTARITFGRATVDTVSGVVQLHGTITCLGTAVFADVFGILRQVRNGFFARGSGSAAPATCGSAPKPWTMAVESETVRAFVPGQASLDFFFEACDTVECLPVRQGTIRRTLRGV
ncbi:MAG: hypothetical protein QOJ13_2756 [Gaiellales bacterium]|jgi:hypothetical protein|nr:hypothetical protein [Gaiellales bacterium]